MKALFLLPILASVLLTACGGSSSSGTTSTQLTSDLLPATVALQAAHTKALQGLEQFSSRVTNDSVTLLTRTESMLEKMTDNRETLLNTLVDIATQPFAMSNSESIQTVTANLNTPPFVIPPLGLSTNFLLLSSRSRFLTPNNTIKTRFKTPAELAVAWLRAIEFSNQRCVYVALQSVGASGIVTAASNTLIVSLPTAAADECGTQI